GMREVEGFNAKLAVLITHAVGSMAMAYIFSLIALTSLPAILIQAGVLTNSDVPKFLTKPGLILIVAWVAQTFIQLVLLSIIMVGQDVQAKAADKRAEDTYLDAEAVLHEAQEIQNHLAAQDAAIEAIAASAGVKLATVRPAAQPGPAAAG
ncbi:MAG TPA: hypothetical protein VKY26_02975, partial [Actinomycetota bacterium]|nr:hypothetical protein [Actinomycetota bacterium]